MVEVLYTAEFEAWWGTLRSSEQEDVDVVVHLIEDQGVTLGWPYSSAIQGSRLALRELRVQSSGHPLRVFYAFDPWRDAVLLIGGDKTGDDRFYDEDDPQGRDDPGDVFGRGNRETEEGEVAMVAKRYEDLRRRTFSSEQQERIERRVEQELLEINLKGLRELTGKTQDEMAEIVKMSQGQVSTTERRDDHLVSTLRRYVEALGGELEISASFGDKRYRLHGV